MVLIKNQFDLGIHGYWIEIPGIKQRRVNIMLFNSFAFAIFLPIVFTLYWILPHKFRWIILLVSSYYFYMSWNAKYVFLILFTTAISYVAGLLLEKLTDSKKKKWVLAATVILCLGVLFFFKYFNFVMESVSAFLSLFAIQMSPLTLKLLLPVGISFYTFQTLSYVIDVYKGDSAAEHHFGYYAAFISFFPQLVAGPIERTKNLLPQIKERHVFSYDQATYGLKLMAWGFFKKIVIADTLSKYVSKIYDAPQAYHGFSLVLATVFFSFQIYCDFSGYSDIAIGTSKLMGINLMTNFKSPYFSQSIKEFWSRWHISLSTWFRDYVYIPLGGNRVGKIRHYMNLLITFLVSGLWHGANWTFVLWGGIHGAAQVCENALSGKKKEKPRKKINWIKILLVFVFCAFAWIFFVADSISDAGYVITHMFEGISSPIVYLSSGLSDLGLGALKLGIIAFTLLILSIYDYFSLKGDCIEWLGKQRFIIRHILYIFIVLLILSLRATEEAQFVYFQF